jgi:hypothetical protein
MSTQLPTSARVVLFTADACITADLATGGERVKDVLNYPQALLDLTRLTYSNPDRPGIPLVDYAAGSLRKSDVGCVVVLSEPPQQAMRKIGVYVQKKSIRVSIMIPGMVVVGTLHIQGRYDPTLLLTDAPESFMPLTEAGVVRARTTTPTSVPPERLTVFVNRAHISGILLTENVDYATLEPAPRGDAARHPAQTGTARQPVPGENAPRQTGRLRRFTNDDPNW